MATNIQSVERAAAILALLADARRLGVVELAGQLELPKGTVHGLLRTLQRVGLVEQDPGSSKYQLGAALLHLGSSYLDANELRAHALNWADALAAHTGAAVRIGALHDRQVLVVHHVFAPDGGRQALEIGLLLPAHATALGKVLLAHHPFVAGQLAQHALPALTTATVTTPGCLDRELRRVRAQGWGQENGELSSDRASIAAPITDRHGTAVGAIAVGGSPGRLLIGNHPRRDVLGRVREAAAAVSRELGALPW